MARKNYRTNRSLRAKFQTSQGILRKVGALRTPYVIHAIVVRATYDIHRTSSTYVVGLKKYTQFHLTFKLRIKQYENICGKKNFLKCHNTTETTMCISGILLLVGHVRGHCNHYTKESSSVLLCVRISVTSQAQLATIISSYF